MGHHSSGAARAARAGLLAACLLLAACGDDGEPPVAPLPLATAYYLVAVDGQPLPAAIDSSIDDGGDVTLVRIVARTLELVSADSAQYAELNDVVERLAGGTLTPWSVNCSSMRVGWRRVGNQIVVDLPPSWMRPDGMVDTLTLARRALFQVHREPHPPGTPARRSWPLEYREGRPATPLCLIQAPVYERK